MGETKKSYGSGSASTTGYTVEVRSTFPTPEIHPLGFIIDGEWRRAPYRLSKCDRTDHNHYQSGKIGDIPVWNYDHMVDHLELLNFNAAYALACQIQAQLWNGGCVECRLVTVRVKYSYEAAEESTGEPISLVDLMRSMKFEKSLPAPPEANQ
jgi:hypothetical protein